MWKKRLRITAGILFLVFLAVTFIPKLYLANSSDGVVNARTVTLRSPIEGKVEYRDSRLRHGAFYRKGSVIGTVSNDRLDSSFLYKLQTEKITLESRAGIMRKRLEKYLALSGELRENLQKYQKFNEKQYEMQIAQNGSQLKSEQAECERARLNHEANRKMFEKNAIRLREVETTQSRLLQSEARILELKQRRGELENKLEAVRNGVFLGDGNNDVPYSNQRRDQLVIETALAEAALAESEDRLKGIELQIEMEKKRLETMREFKIQAPFDCLVWRIPAGEESTVAINSELIVLMDCGTVFLDVTVPEYLFSRIPRGSAVEYRLRGETRFHKGIVAARRGSGMQGRMYELAAVPVNDPKREFRVWIEADRKDLSLSVDNFYRIGQRVDVKFARAWNPIQDIARFFNVF